MQRIDFFRLERPVQERFIAAARGAASPVPLALRAEPLPRGVLLWAGVGALSLLLLGALTLLGFGRMDSSFALHAPWTLGGYVALALMVAFATWRARMVHKARRALPFVPGVYVFPSGVIDTRGPQFVVRPLSGLGSVEPKRHSLRLTFDDGSQYSFPVQRREQADELKRVLLELKQSYGELARTATARELALLDPLCDNGFKNPFSPTESLRPPRVGRVRWTWIAAVAASLAAALGLWKVRNVLAEEALYGVARAENTRAAYATYLERGGRRMDVSEILLPRTELAEVIAEGSLERLEGYADANADSPIAPEIQSALQRALSARLEDAKRAGTLKALRDFADRYGKHPFIGPEVQRSLDDYWKARLAAFQQSARPKAEAMDLFRRLLAYSVAHGNRVEVRFRRRLPESVGRAEAMLQKSLYFGGPASLPAQYFDAPHAEAREEPVGKELVAALSQAFPKDLLDFQLAAPLQDSDEDLPKVTVPTLLVTHRTEMSGAYLMRKPRAALTGIGVLFRVTFQIPNDPRAHLFKYSAWNAPDTKQALEGASFEAIYDQMASRAFKKLPQKYLAELLPGLAN